MGQQGLLHKRFGCLQDHQIGNQSSAGDSRVKFTQHSGQLI